MGCDIHAVWQEKTSEGYRTVHSPEWDQGRDYFLFAWLADVRNGYGFAGVPTHARIEPISEQRGLPQDFQIDDNQYHGPVEKESLCPWRQRLWGDGHDDETSKMVWIGDHSHSWLTFDEILSASRPDSVWTCGVISIEEFRKWDGVSAPARYSGDIMGHGIKRAATPVEVQDDTAHVRVFWKETNDQLGYFIQYVQLMRDRHGEGRLVFGFDS